MGQFVESHEFISTTVYDSIKWALATEEKSSDCQGPEVWGRGLTSRAKRELFGVTEICCLDCGVCYMGEYICHTH